MDIDSNNKDNGISIKSWWKKFTHLSKQVIPKEGKHIHKTVIVLYRLFMYFSSRGSYIWCTIRGKRAKCKGNNRLCG